jgi:hypothetical protein
LFLTGLHATKERRKRLIHATQHVLTRSEVRHAYIPAAGIAFNCVAWSTEAEADTVHPSRRAALVERGAVETAGFVDLAVQRFGRRRVGAVPAAKAG